MRPAQEPWGLQREIKKIMLIVIRVTFVFLLLMSLPAGGFPAEKPGLFPGAKEETRPAKPEKAPEDPLGRGTPQGTVFGFIKSATQEDYDRAIRYLETNKRGPAAQKIIYALHVILERGFSGKLPILSSKPEGNLEDNLPSTRERIGTVQTQSGSWDIFLDRVQRGDNPPIWVFSARTLAKVPEIYQGLMSAPSTNTFRSSW